MSNNINNSINSNNNNDNDNRHRNNDPRRRILFVLHGSRQTGDLLLGRMDKLRKRLAKNPNANVHLVAPTASFPHPQDAEMRRWWEWEHGTDTYHGLMDVTVPQLEQLWNDARGRAVGFLGFSQGARLVHLLTVLHEAHPDRYFPGLLFVMMVAGYEAPWPDNITTVSETEASRLLTTPSLHVWGTADTLITPAQSQANAGRYQNPVLLVHEGGHHVPMRAANVRTYAEFIERVLSTENGENTSLLMPNQTSRNGVANSLGERESNIEPTMEPDEDTKQVQQDEVEAMMAIFPDEFQLLSEFTTNDDGTRSYSSPIQYHIFLDATDQGVWPPRPLQLGVTYPPTYPQSSGPQLELIHQNNVLEFSTAQRDACRQVMQEAIQIEEGMPCVYACYAAVKEFFESGVMAQVMTKTLPLTAATTTTTTTTTTTATKKQSSNEADDNTVAETTTTSPTVTMTLLKTCSTERNEKCNQQGLDIAASILKDLGAVRGIHPSLSASTDDDTVDGRLSQMNRFKGGSWMYTIGLVGKPSAGKSTFFNAATAFARQRDDADNILGGASMAPHPFTTIDPNVGFCLVPAPDGLCPEDDYQGDMVVGSTHGRDHRGRRLLPVVLKDVAGLVPGAYQGRGRGNKFLNDLTDADVLVHVLDASGTADVEGNDLGLEDGDKPHGAASHPLNDMEWVRRELIEWIYANLMAKWSTIARKGRSKLMGMFSGYGQNQGLLWTILNAVEKFMAKHYHRDRALENVEDWDEGDVRRLVSAFLGVRFAMTLALNKSDLLSSASHISDIQKALPVHGAYSGTPLCAHDEMLFVKKRLEQALAGNGEIRHREGNERIPQGVWSCLTSALSLHEPILVFPVADFVDYTPLPGMTRHATEDASLPSVGMISCLRAAGGHAPSMWDADTTQYASTRKTRPPALRDVLVMKPGSTVDDVFVALKNRRALEGEFVRAEAAGRLGMPSRPIPKHQLIGTSYRILRIMTTKKSSWQHNFRS